MYAKGCIFVRRCLAHPVLFSPERPCINTPSHPEAFLFYCRRTTTGAGDSLTAAAAWAYLCGLWLEKLAPEKPYEQYAHNGFEDNADAHLKRTVMGREVVAAVTEGRLDFGPWEQIFYGEFDGMRRDTEQIPRREAPPVRHDKVPRKDYTELGVKGAAAIRTGGFTGDNGFYYHEAFGSYVCIQTVISTAGEPEVYERARSECLHCGSCAKSCAAVKDLRGCIRAHTCRGL